MPSPTTNNLGEVQVIRASFLLAREEDRGPNIRAAMGLYRKAIELLPNDADHWANLARAHGILATWVLEQGGDPRPDLSKAEEALTRARELNPALTYAVDGCNLGKIFGHAFIAHRNAAIPPCIVNFLPFYGIIVLSRLVFEHSCRSRDVAFASAPAHCSLTGWHFLTRAIGE